MHRLICLILLLSSTNLLANERERLAEAAFSSSQQIADSRLQRQNQAYSITYGSMCTPPPCTPSPVLAHAKRLAMNTGNA